MGNVTNKALRDKAIKKIVDLCNAFEAMYGVKLVVREQTELANEIAVKKAIAELDGEQRAGDYTTIALYKLWGCGSKRQLDANNKYSEGHARHYAENETRRQYRSAKHRYIYITGSKTDKRRLSKQLRYTVADYPKGNSAHYDVESPTPLKGKQI